MIPDEAIEAATKALLKARGYETTQDSGTSADMRIALEAAAPHLMAVAWDEGRKHGASFPFGERGLATDDNPYRK